jgi:hypothetical protein
MRDMASNISGTNRKLSATPRKTCGQQMSQNPADRLSPERSNTMIESLAKSFQKNRLGQRLRPASCKPLQYAKSKQLRK